MRVQTNRSMHVLGLWLRHVHVNKACGGRELRLWAHATVTATQWDGRKHPERDLARPGACK